jgi:hypothetical protein
LRPARASAKASAPPVESVNVYAFLCELLGISPASHDGDLSVTRAFVE